MAEPEKSSLRSWVLKSGLNSVSQGLEVPDIALRAVQASRRTP